ncbi:MAG: hypothetical protein CR984_00680 [Proteobacteria bacterium]|nr:MAG: hypothetical protein CR984_00680 [Pseudomonadota bacterium]PIE67014.1 MAG: hypothetical protein CSA23_05990 [Deltaproteobacteria bacterium]
MIEPQRSIVSMTNKYTHRFDFDIGYLIKSPCRECTDHYLFPGCMDSCLSLDRVRTVLANSVSCSRTCASVESHAIFQDSMKDE